MAVRRTALHPCRLVLLFALSSACSSDPDGPLSSSAGPPMGACNAVETRFETGSAVHLPECSDIEYPMNPPVAGDHYPVWAAYQTYEFPVPSGYLVHSLEHGAVLFFYDCPDGCVDEVAELQAFIDDLPSDPRCAENVKHQVIIAPRPDLGARFAAAAWGYSLSADCFEREFFQQFYDSHLARGPEDLCAQGVSIEASACQ